MSQQQPSPSSSPPHLRYGSLVLLVFQNCTSVILMRYVQTPGRPPFSIPLVNLVVEVVKFVICSVSLTLYEAHVNPQYSQILFSSSPSTSSSSSSFWKQVKDYYLQPMKLAIFRKPCLQMAIPSGLYTLQNNLLFVALANLDATLFQVSYQLKLIFTVVLMVLMLGREISKMKWMILTLLFAGIVLTQLKPKSVKNNNNNANNGNAKDEENVAVGMVAVVACSMSSAFASVYFEKILKGATSISSLPNSTNSRSSTSSSTSLVVNEDSNTSTTNNTNIAENNRNITLSSEDQQDEAQRLDKELRAEQAFFTSLSVRNIQLSIFAFLFNFLVWMYKANMMNSNQVVVFVAQQESGGLTMKISSLFSGFDAYVWFLVLTQAAGGLLVAAVIKFADNILKGFATAFAIVVNGIVSYFMFDFVPSSLFSLGAAIVIVSTVLYSM